MNETKKTATRIYVVTTVATGAESLVNATSQAQALRHLSEHMLTCEVASQSALVRLLSVGAKIVDAAATSVPVTQSELDEAAKIGEPENFILPGPDPIDVPPEFGRKSRAGRAS